MKQLVIILALMLPNLVYSQVPNAQSLVALHSVTSAERNAITGATDGMMLYDTDEKTLYTYSSTDGWQKLQVGPSTYVGSFVISASGTQTITGLPFKPSQITFTAHANVESMDLDSDNGSANNATNISNAFGTMTGFARDESGSFVQQAIYIGASGNSLNDISRYASSSHCIGVRYSNQNGDDLGKILSSINDFNADGFTIDNTYVNGTVTVVNNGNPANNISPTAVLNESLVVLYTAYQ